MMLQLVGTAKTRKPQPGRSGRRTALRAAQPKRAAGRRRSGFPADAWTAWHERQTF